jgi:hypothetical protein
MSNASSRFRVENRISVVLVLVVVAALTFSVVVLTSHSKLSTSTTEAGSNCAPYNFPVVKLGHHASVRVEFDGFRATFAATATRQDTIVGEPNGMPFTGTLTVAKGAQTWRLPAPSLTKNYQIDELCVISFAKNTGPAVLSEGFTGGAHCCELPVLYALRQSTDRFVKVLDMTPTNFKYSLAFDINGGFRPTLVGPNDSRVLLRTEDDHFAYTFGCYACTPMPIVLDEFNGTKLTDVTGQYPSLIRPEASSLLKQATTLAKGEHNPSFEGIGPFGALAAWVADECALDRGSEAWSKVLSFQGKGELSNKVYYADTLIRGSYVAQLRKFLLNGDYCTGQFGE